MYKFTLKTFKRKVVSEGTLLINHKYDITGDGSNKQPTYVRQLQSDGTDGSSAEDRISKRVDERLNNGSS